MKRAQPLLIAEVGVNHNGSTQLARELVSAAVEAGADAVKFQTFRADLLASPATPKVRYQERDTTSSSHLTMLQKLELTDVQHHEIADYCRQLGIEFMSTPYGPEGVQLLDELGVRRFKTASADIVDIPLHEAIAATGRPVIISTGMATLEEIALALAVYPEAAATVTLMHAVSKYPTPIGEANLTRMLRLADAFALPVGYSDHTEGIAASAAAVALGAVAIEKHFTLDKRAEGPDHLASADPEEFRALVALIREVDSALGTGGFELPPEEVDMARTSRKSLHVTRGLPAGATVGIDDVVLRRPGTGVMWSDRHLVIGRTVQRTLSPGDMITLQDLA
jgi:N-acetylneuraminate synthase/N,N'-diacetyllegionaminate synthase